MQTPYPHLFSPIEIAGLTLRNRILMAPMESHLCNADGSVTSEMIAYYRERALGGAGMIVVEYTCVDSLDGHSSIAPQLRLDSPFLRAGQGKLAAAIKSAGARACIQISHAGRQTRETVIGGRTPISSSDSPLNSFYMNTKPRPMSEDDIARVIRRFSEAAGYAVACGYDAVMLHGAHGYLLQQFLSPLVNNRTDSWGGDFDRRLAFPLAVVKAVKQAIGAAPLFYRLSVSDFIEGGLTIEDSERIAQRLCEAGVDAIDISMGSLERVDVIVEPMSTPEGWRLPLARRIRAATGRPVFCAGVMRHPEKAEAALAEGDTDCISLGRALLADPFWPAKARAGRAEDIRPCTSCNWCIMQTGANRPVGCAENPRCGRETDALIAPTAPGRRAIVVGAGPGGMAAALLLDQAGFDVALHEKRAQAGGNLITSATPPGKEKLFWYHDFLLGRLNASEIKLHLNSEADADMIAAARPDLVVIATGARLAPLKAPLENGPPVAPAYAVLLGDLTDIAGAPDRPITIYGGGETGAETAEYLAQRGQHVLLITRSKRSFIARNAEPLYRMGLLKRLAENDNIEILDEHRLAGVDPSGLTLIGPSGEAVARPVSSLLLAHGLAPDDQLARALARRDIKAITIGDAQRVARIGEAVNAAYLAIKDTLRLMGRNDVLAC